MSKSQKTATDVSACQYMTVHLHTRQCMSEHISISPYISIDVNKNQHISIHVNSRQLNLIHVSTLIMCQYQFMNVNTCHYILNTISLRYLFSSERSQFHATLQSRTLPLPPPPPPLQVPPFYFPQQSTDLHKTMYRRYATAHSCSVSKHKEL